MLARVVALTVASTLIGPLPFASAATSDATFMRRANAVCRAEGAKVAALPPVHDDNAVVVLGQLADIVDGLVGRLKRIEPPRAKAARYRVYLDTTRQSVTYLRRAIAAIERHDARVARSSMSQAVQTDTRGTGYAHVLGLADCAKDY